MEPQEPYVDPHYNPWYAHFGLAWRQAQAEYGYPTPAPPGVKPPPCVKDLPLKLEMLYHGGMTETAIREVRENHFLPDLQQFNRSANFQINIVAGWKAGTKITFNDSYPASHMLYPGECPADVIFMVREEQHPFLERKDDDLIFRVTLTNDQAKKPQKVTVPLPSGEEVSVATAGLKIKTGTQLVVPDKGMPIKHTAHFGDLVVHFIVGTTLGVLKDMVNSMIPVMCTSIHRIEVQPMPDGTYSSGGIAMDSANGTGSRIDRLQARRYNPRQQDSDSAHPPGTGSLMDVD